MFTVRSILKISEVYLEDGAIFKISTVRFYIKSYSFNQISVY